MYRVSEVQSDSIRAYPDSHSFRPEDANPDSEGFDAHESQQKEYSLIMF